MAQEPKLPNGIKKETVRYPPTHKYVAPQEGDEVEVHYVISLKSNGRVVASSRAAGEVYKYKIGEEEVIRGWELGLKTLKKGETAKFTIAPHLAYGEEGREGDVPVPPNASIILELELVNYPLREDLFSDGGCIKLEVKDNPNGRTPRKGDEVQINYKVTVDGAGVVMGAQHAVYKLGAEQMGQIAKCMDAALVTMKRGDEALLTCQPSYAFGMSGSKHAGKEARIVILLEEIYEVHDMSVGDRDKTVLRKRIKEGEGNDRIHDTATVTIQITGVTAHTEKIMKEKKEVTFTVGDGQVCDAIEGSVLEMRKGEEAILRVESVEACLGGHLDLPSKMELPVMIHIKILSFNNVMEKWDMDGPQRIQRGRERKALAGDLFKQGRVRLAAHHYEKVADLFARKDFFAVEDQKDAAELRRMADLNRALCMLKMGDMKKVASLCTSVLNEDPCQPKALFRRAKAQLQMKEYDEAITDLARLLEVEPTNTDGKQLMREAKRLRKQNDECQSRHFSKMCDALGELPERETRPGDGKIVMPEIDKEYEKIAQKFGLPIKKTDANTSNTTHASRSSSSGIPSGSSSSSQLAGDQPLESVAEVPEAENNVSASVAANSTPEEVKEPRVAEDVHPSVSNEGQAQEQGDRLDSMS